jgi:hypothetical protein
MRRGVRLLIGSLVIGAVALAAAAMPRSEPELHLAAKIFESSASGRAAFRPVEIVVSDWSTGETHRMLARTLLERGPLAFLDALCNLWPRGSVRVLGNTDVQIRYAWRVVGRNGAQRIYIASDSSIPLTASWFRLPSDAEPLVFLELHLDQDGTGVGKLSEARRLTVDQSRDIIELRDYVERPAQLVMVERIAAVEH